MTSVPKPNSKPPQFSTQPLEAPKAEVVSAEPAGWAPASTAKVTEPLGAAAPPTPSTPATNMSVLGALGDGTATLKIPLRPGDYELNGIKFTVEPPGSTAEVRVKIKNGEFVPAKKGEPGTEVTITPPLSLPLWLKGEGVKLKGDAAQQELQLKLGGFFDLSFKSKKLSEIVGGDSGPVTSKGSQPPSELRDLADRLLDLSQMQVDAQVSMREGPLDVSGTKVQVQPETLFSIKGDGHTTVVKGQVGLEALAIEQPDLQLASTGKSSASLDMTIEKTASGHLLNSRLHIPRLSIDHFAASRMSNTATGAVEKLLLGPTEIRDATIQLSSKVSLNGTQLPSFTPPVVGAWFNAKGVIKDSLFYVPDQLTPGRVKVSGQFEGLVFYGSSNNSSGNVQGLGIEGELRGAHVDVRDLKQQVKDKHFLIDRVQADGTLSVKLSPDQLVIQGETKHIDVMMHDFHSKGSQLHLDMGPTHVSGAGTISIDSNGLKAKGSFPGASAVVEEASYTTDSGRTTTIARSVFRGKVRELDFTGDDPILRFEGLETELQVSNLPVEGKGATAQISGKLNGHADGVLINAKGLTLQNGMLDVQALVNSNVPHNLIPGVPLHSTSDINGTVAVKLEHAHVENGALTFDSAEAQLAARAGAQDPVRNTRKPLAIYDTAHVEQSTPAQLAQVAPSNAAVGSPTDALRLLRDGTVEVEIPLKGNVSGLGIDWVKLEGAKMQVALVVKDGKIVASQTKAIIGNKGIQVIGGAKRGGIDVVGAHLDENHRLHLDVQALGVQQSVPAMKIPTTMEQLAQLLGSKDSSSAAGLGQHFDLSQARLDITNATFKGGQVAIPGGSIDVAEGSKLSFHGTPLNGELTGSIGIGPGGVQLTQEKLAVKGSEGRANLKVAFRREGSRAVVDTCLSELQGKVDYLVYKAGHGDYVSLGVGQLSGATMTFRAEMPLGANGLPTVGAATVSNTSLNVQKFSGDLKGARTTSAQGAVIEVGPTHVDGHISYTPAHELLLIAKVSQLDAAVQAVSVSDGKRRQLHVDSGQFSGSSGEIRIAPDMLSLSADGLTWDLKGKIAEASSESSPVRHGQVHVFGQGNVAYDSATGGLQIRGALFAEGDLRAAPPPEPPARKPARS